MNYYNELDLYCVAWLRNLISAGLIPDGHVDDRPIQKVTPTDLNGYTQCHFFAGIAGWSLALQLASWSSTDAVWTGSCPCQPFSAAGQRKGTSDERHLWPEFKRLISVCKPSVVFGEQVASADGRQWLDGVRTDLEDLDYAVGAADLCAASVGAPDIRQRLWWVADSGQQRIRDKGCPTNVRAAGGTESFGSERERIWDDVGNGHDGLPIGMVHTKHTERRALNSTRADEGRNGLSQREEGADRAGGASTDGFWSNFDLIPCADGKTRRVPSPQSGVFSMVNGLWIRVDTVRAAAITKAKEEIVAYAKRTETRPGEILRMVREVNEKDETIQGQAGGSIMLPKKEVLLSFLFGIEAELDSTTYDSGLSQASTPESIELLRSVWRERGTSYSPCGSESDEQRGLEQADSLQSLSRILAWCAETVAEAVALANAETFPLRRRTPARVGKLRAYGNAINPYAAAEFIQAFQETRS